MGYSDTTFSGSLLALDMAEIVVDMPQVCFPFATDGKGKTLYEPVQANPQFLLGQGP